MTSPNPPARGLARSNLPYLSIRTERLELIAATSMMLEAEIHDRTRLSDLLQAEVPGNWPPILRLDSLTWTRELLNVDPGLYTWLDWYVVLRAPADATPVLIGSTGFHGRPTPDGALTVNYALTPQFEGCGYAVEAVAALISWAFTHEQVETIRADTYAVLNASISLLEKLGFRLLGCSPDRMAMGYELKRKDYLPVLKAF